MVGMDGFRRVSRRAWRGVARGLSGVGVIVRGIGLAMGLMGSMGVMGMGRIMIVIMTTTRMMIEEGGGRMGERVVIMGMIMIMMIDQADTAEKEMMRMDRTIIWMVRIMIMIAVVKMAVKTTTIAIGIFQLAKMAMITTTMAVKGFEYHSKEETMAMITYREAVKTPTKNPNVLEAHAQQPRVQEPKPGLGLTQLLGLALLSQWLQSLLELLLPLLVLYCYRYVTVYCSTDDIDSTNSVADRYRRLESQYTGVLVGSLLPFVLLLGERDTLLGASGGCLLIDWYTWLRLM